MVCPCYLNRRRECSGRAALDALVKANRIKNSAELNPTSSETTIDGVKVHALITKGRIVNSLQFRVGNVVVVTNSLAQVRKLAKVEQFPRLEGRRMSMVLTPRK